MDMDSPDKPVEGIKEENVSSPLENPDTDLFWNKDDQRDGKFIHESELPNNGLQVYLGQEYPMSTGPHVDVQNQELQSLIMKPNSADMSSPANKHEESFLPNESDLNHQNTERFYTEEQQFSIDDYQGNAKQEEAEDADHLTHSGGFLDNSINETRNNVFHTESSYSLAHSSLLTGDDENFYPTVGDEASNHQIVEFPPLNEAKNGDMEVASANFQSDKLEVHAEMDGGNLGAHTETMEDDYSNAMASSENGGMVWENSSLHSPQRTKNASPSPERQFSISAEKSPHLQPSPQNHPSSGRELSEANNDNKLAPSPRSSKRKRSPSLDKHNEGSKRRSSARQRSPSRRTTQRDPHHRDGSPRKHVAHSPRRRDSPPRRSRSSRSPLRSRDSPGRRRDSHHRSRSRSPYARDRYRRSPRRRPSPRRRSPPPSYSRHRSSKRAWSPPANRNTGLGKPGKNLFIAGFSYATTERDLEKKFSRFGRVTDVRVVREPRSGESRGFGFLSLERDEDADAAIRALDQTEWHGRVLLVEKSKSSTR